MTVKELKSILDKFDENTDVCLAKRSRKNPQWASDIGRVELMKLAPYLDCTNPYKDMDGQDMVVIGISGEIGEVYKD